MKYQAIISWDTKRQDTITYIITQEIHGHVIVNSTITWSKRYYLSNLYRLLRSEILDTIVTEKICYKPFDIFVWECIDQQTSDSKCYFSKTFQEEYDYLYIDNAYEVDKILTLLYGISLKEVAEDLTLIPNKVNRDLIGAESWDSFESLFKVLNHCVPYVVMRNFDDIPNSYYVGEHGDIDLLVSDYKEIIKITNCEIVFPEKYRVQCLVNVAGKKEQFDFRYVGDGYYDKKWEIDILKRRETFNGVFVPNENDYKYMLLYHALIHKKNISKDYAINIDKLFEDGSGNIKTLIQYLYDNDYQITIPQDLSVIYNWRNCGKKPPVFRCIRVFAKRVDNKLNRIWRRIRNR